MNNSYKVKMIKCFFIYSILLSIMMGCLKVMPPDGKVQSNSQEPYEKTVNSMVFVSSLSNGYGFTIKTGDTKQMSVKIAPDNASDKSVEWSTNDSSIACIDSKTGLLTAKSAGVVKVTVRALDGSGVKDTCTVTVVKGTSTWKPTANHKITNPSLPYYLYFEKDAYTLSVYGKGNDGYYSKLIKIISSSRGRTLSMTPAGTFKLAKEKRWYQFKIGKYWTQYCIRYASDIYLHSPLYKKMAGDTMYINEYNQIGTASTAGCLAMATADIKWIWDNCPNGTTLEIANGAPIGIVAEVPPRIPEDGPTIDPSDPEFK